MRLGSAGEWGAASQLMDRGVNEVGNLTRGGTIQEIKTQNIKKFATDILTLMQQGDPEAITPEILIQYAEQYDLDPVEASGVLNVIMGFQDKMKGRAEGEAYRKGAKAEDLEAYKREKYLGLKPQKRNTSVVRERARVVDTDTGEVIAEGLEKTFAPKAERAEQTVGIFKKTNAGIRTDKIPVSKLKEYQDQGWRRGNLKATAGTKGMEDISYETIDGVDYEVTKQGDKIMKKKPVFKPGEKEAKKSKAEQSLYDMFYSKASSLAGGSAMMGFDEEKGIQVSHTAEIATLLSTHAKMEPAAALNKAAELVAKGVTPDAVKSQLDIISQPAKAPQGGSPTQKPLMDWRTLR